MGSLGKPHNRSTSTVGALFRRRIRILESRIGHLHIDRLTVTTLAIDSGTHFAPFTAPRSRN